MKRRVALIFAYLVIISFAFFLLFWNLDNYPLWDDEANTAIFSRNYLETGELIAFDGQNIVAYMNGSELNRSLINVKMPPFMYYMGACSYRMFGISDFSSRLPFAFLGFLEVILFMLLVYKLFKSHTLVMLSTIILITNVSFLLFARQCRYYSPASFFTLLYIYSVIGHFTNGKTFNIYIVLLPVSATFLFLSHFMVAVSLLFVVFLFVTYHYRSNVIQNKYYIYYFITNIITVIFILLYIYYVSPFDTLYKIPSLGLVKRLGIISRSLMAMDMYNWFSYPLYIFFLAIVWINGNKPRLNGNGFPKLHQIILFILLNVVVISLMNGSKFKMRFNVHLISLIALTNGCIIYSIISLPGKLYNLVGILIFILVIFTSIPYINRDHYNSSKIFEGKVNSYFTGFIGELKNKTESTYQKIYEVLDTLPQSSSIYLYPEFMSYPVMYKYDKKFNICGQLDSLMEIDHNLPEYVYKSKASPEYIVYSGNDIHEFNKKLPWLKKNYEIIKHINYFWADFKKPEIVNHLFMPKKEFNSKSETIYIFKIKSGSNGF